MIKIENVNYFHLRYVDILAIWKVIYQTKRFPSKNPAEILNSIKLDYSFGGSFPLEAGFNTALNQKIIEVKSDEISLTMRGANLICEEDLYEPSHKNLQDIIYGILLEKKFYWIFFFNSNRETFKSAIPPNWIQILDNAKLLDVESESVKAWWKSLLSKYNEQKEKRLKEIGDIGEELTVEFERKRLNEDLLNPAKYVRRVSVYDDTVGYDILSVKGQAYKGGSTSKLLIEVKASQKDSLSLFRFKLTRNEWETAIRNIGEYYFYLWVGVKNVNEYSAGPFRIDAADLEGSVPIDQKEGNRWEVCTISLDLTD